MAGPFTSLPDLSQQQSGHPVPPVQTGQSAPPAQPNPLAQPAFLAQPVPSTQPALLAQPAPPAQSAQPAPPAQSAQPAPPAQTAPPSQSAPPAQPVSLAQPGQLVAPGQQAAVQSAEQLDEKTLQQYAYSHFKQQNEFQSFWGALKPGTAENPLVQPLGPSKQRWTRLGSFLSGVRGLRGIKYDPNKVLDALVQSAIWDVTDPSFDLAVFKDDMIWSNIPQVLIGEINCYYKEKKVDWTASEHSAAVDLIKQVFHGELFRPYFIELADTAAKRSAEGFALNAGSCDEEDDNEEEDQSSAGDGRERARNYGSQQDGGAVLPPVTEDDLNFHKVMHPMIYQLYHKLHNAYQNMEKQTTPGENWKQLQTQVPEIGTLQQKIIHHAKTKNTETLPLTLFDLLREWELYWSGHDLRDVKQHLENLWLRESFPRAWIMIPLVENPPQLMLNGLYPSDDERKKEWKRFYGCDPDTGEPLSDMDIDEGNASPAPTTKQEATPQTYYPAAQVVARRMDTIGAIARIPPPTQGSKPWLATQSIPSHGFKSQTIKPQYTDEGQLIVAYKAYLQRGYDAKGKRLVRRFYVVKNELANGCVQYLIRSQIDCGGGGVWNKLNQDNTPQIDLIPKIDEHDLEQGDWIRENSDPPWEVPWVAMPPETAWDGERIPEMAVCFRFTTGGKVYEQVFHRSLLHKYVPPKGVEKAILNCFGMPEMPSLEEFFNQYRAQRQYLRAQQDLHHQRRAITYGPGENAYSNRRKTRNTRSRAKRYVSDYDDSWTSDEYSDQDYESDTPGTSEEEEEEAPPQNLKRTRQKKSKRTKGASSTSDGQHETFAPDNAKQTKQKKSKKTNGAPTGSEYHSLQEQVRLQGERQKAIDDKLSALLARLSVQ